MTCPATCPTIPDITSVVNAFIADGIVEIQEALVLLDPASFPPPIFRLVASTETSTCTISARGNCIRSHDTYSYTEGTLYPAGSNCRWDILRDGYLKGARNNIQLGGSTTGKSSDRLAISRGWYEGPGVAWGPNDLEVTIGEILTFEGRESETASYSGFEICLDPPTPNAFELTFSSRRCDDNPQQSCPTSCFVDATTGCFASNPVGESYGDDFCQFQVLQDGVLDVIRFETEPFFSGLYNENILDYRSFARTAEPDSYQVFAGYQAFYSTWKILTSGKGLRYALQRLPSHSASHPVLHYLKTMGHPAMARA